MSHTPPFEDEFEFEDSPSVRALLALLVPDRPARLQLIYPEPCRDSQVYEMFMRSAYKPALWEAHFFKPEDYDAFLQSP